MLTAQQFQNVGSHEYVSGTHCVFCRREYHRKWIHQRPDKRRAYIAKWKEAHKERAIRIQRAAVRKYHNSHKQEAREYQRVQYAKRRQLVFAPHQFVSSHHCKKCHNAYRRKNYWRTREKRRAYFDRWALAHPTRIKRYAHQAYLKYKTAHPDRLHKPLSAARKQKALEWRRNHRELRRQYRQRTRQIVLEHYGGKPPHCACCGETIYEFLSIDHVISRATLDEEQSVQSGALYGWLIRRNFPSGYQVLCMNCNFSKGTGTHCLHKRASLRQRSQTAKFLYAYRRAILVHYGGSPPKCACCGDDTYDFLTIDHIDGNGAKHRREVVKTLGICRWLIKNNFPSGFQILCMNCNFAKGKYGACPHAKAKDVVGVPAVAG